MNIYKYILLIIGSLLSIITLAQGQNDVERAVQIFQGGNIENAISIIDSCANNTKYNKTWEVWYYKGFFYKELAKKQTVETAIDNRIIAYESIIKAISLDIKRENIEQDSLNLRYLTNKFNNDAAALINESNYKKSEYIFNYYLKALKYQNVDDQKTKQLNIDFKSAMGSMFIEVYEKNSKNVQAYDQIIKNYSAVLQIDSNNANANYQLGVTYYNKGVNIIYLHDVDDLNYEQDQDLALKEFKIALPFLLKSNEINNKRTETLEGLSNIYKALNNKERENYYTEELQKLKNPK